MLRNSRGCGPVKSMVTDCYAHKPMCIATDCYAGKPMCEAVVFCRCTTVPCIADSTDDWWPWNEPAQCKACFSLAEKVVTRTQVDCFYHIFGCTLVPVQPRQSVRIGRRFPLALCSSMRFQTIGSTRHEKAGLIWRFLISTSELCRAPRQWHLSPTLRETSVAFLCQSASVMDAALTSVCCFVVQICIGTP